MMLSDHQEIETSELLSNGSSLGNDGSTDEKNIQDDDRTACRSTTTMHGNHVYVSDISNCQHSTEGKASGIDNDGNNTENEVKNNLRSRERRKSKYLSPPFIDVIKGELKKESESSGDKPIKQSDSPTLVKSGGKRKLPKKSVAGSANLEVITASSADLLLQIRIVARDYLSPYYSKAFDPTKLFFNSFRTSEFSGLDKTRIDEVDVQKKNKRKRKVEPSANCDANVNFASSSPVKVDAQMGSNPLLSKIEPKRKRKRKAEQSPNPEANLLAQNQKSDINCNIGVPGATLDPLQVIGQGEPKSEPVKKKRIRKRRIDHLPTMFGKSYANGNNMKSISLQVCLQDAGRMPYAFVPSTGLNANVVSSPGSCAKGSTSGTPAPPPGFQSNLKAKVVSTPGFCAKGSAPDTPAPLSGFQFILNTNIVNSPGTCAKGSTSSTPAPPSGFQSNLNGNIGSSPGLCAEEGSIPSTPLVPSSRNQSNLNANIVSSPGICANGSTPNTFVSPSGFQCIPHPNIARAPGLCVKGSIPSTPAAPPSEILSNLNANILSAPGICANESTPNTLASPSVFQCIPNANIAIAPGLCEKGSIPSTPAAPPSGIQSNLNANILSSPGIYANGSTPNTLASPSGFHSIPNANIDNSPGFCAKDGSTASTPFTLSAVQSMGRVNTATGDPLQATSHGEPKSEPVKKKKKIRRRVDHLATMFGNSYANWGPRPYGFSASTGPNANHLSSQGFCAKGSTPSTPFPPSGSQSMGRVNTPIGFDTNDSKSNSKMSLDQMKQSLEFMTSMLEKSGDMISPAMRANLEKEIKNLLQKVNPMIS